MKSKYEQCLNYESIFVTLSLKYSTWTATRLGRRFQTRSKPTKTI